ncbi:MAG: hypothetical protein R3B57_01670 [Phycisphaerales bacterium]
MPQKPKPPYELDLKNPSADWERLMDDLMKELGKLPEAKRHEVQQELNGTTYRKHGQTGLSLRALKDLEPKRRAGKEEQQPPTRKTLSRLRIAADVLGYRSRAVFVREGPYAAMMAVSALASCLKPLLESGDEEEPPNHDAAVGACIEAFVAVAVEAAERRLEGLGARLCHVAFAMDGDRNELRLVSENNLEFPHAFYATRRLRRLPASILNAPARMSLVPLEEGECSRVGLLRGEPLVDTWALKARWGTSGIIVFLGWRRESGECPEGEKKEDLATTKAPDKLGEPNKTDAARTILERLREDLQPAARYFVGTLASSDIDVSKTPAMGDVDLDHFYVQLLKVIEADRKYVKRLAGIQTLASMLVSKLADGRHRSNAHWVVPVVVGNQGASGRAPEYRYDPDRVRLVYRQGDMDEEVDPEEFASFVGDLSAGHVRAILQMHQDAGAGEQSRYALFPIRDVGVSQALPVIEQGREGQSLSVVAASLSAPLRVIEDGADTGVAPTDGENGPDVGVQDRTAWLLDQRVATNPADKRNHPSELVIPICPPVREDDAYPPLPVAVVTVEQNPGDDGVQNPLSDEVGRGVDRIGRLCGAIEGLHQRVSVEEDDGAKMLQFMKRLFEEPQFIKRERVAQEFCSVTRKRLGAEVAYLLLRESGTMGFRPVGVSVDASLIDRYYLPRAGGGKGKKGQPTRDASGVTPRIRGKYTIDDIRKVIAKSPTDGDKLEAWFTNDFLLPMLERAVRAHLAPKKRLTSWSVYQDGRPQFLPKYVTHDSAPSVLLHDFGVKQALCLPFAETPDSLRRGVLWYCWCANPGEDCERPFPDSSDESGQSYADEQMQRLQPLTCLIATLYELLMAG